MCKREYIPMNACKYGLEIPFVSIKFVCARSNVYRMEWVSAALKCQNMGYIRVFIVPSTMAR